MWGRSFSGALLDASSHKAMTSIHTELRVTASEEYVANNTATAMDHFGILLHRIATSIAAPATAKYARCSAMISANGKMQYAASGDSRRSTTDAPSNRSRLSRLKPSTTSPMMTDAETNTDIVGLVIGTDSG